MIYDQFTRYVGKAGLKLKEFAELVGMTPQSLSNYASKGNVPSHLVIIAVLMGEMADKRLEFRKLIQTLDIPKKKPRSRSAVNPTAQVKDLQSQVPGIVEPKSKIGKDLVAPPSSAKRRARRGPGAQNNRIL